MAANKAVHGLYSCKQRVPQGQDQWGKPISFNCTAAPFYEAPRASRDCYKGKQIITKTHLPHFSKLEQKVISMNTLLNGSD